MKLAKENQTLVESELHTLTAKYNSLIDDFTSLQEEKGGISDRAAIAEENLALIKDQRALDAENLANMEKMMEKMHDMNASLQLKIDLMEKDQRERDASRCVVVIVVHEWNDLVVFCSSLFLC